MNEVLLSSKKMDWYTTQYFYDELDKQFHFVLDPAATEKTAKCKLYYTSCTAENCDACENEQFRDDAVAFAVNQWTKMGIGFFCEDLRESKHTGYTVVRRYFGSHIYDTTSMSRLIDYIVQEAKELGIETMPPDEIERIKHLWQ